jgi:anhydro-N-acetylmuramic acid kinase
MLIIIKFVKKVLKDTFLIAYFQYAFYIFTDMHDNFIYSIGLMSGTSLDGLDLVYVQFDKNAYKNFKIIAAKTYSYSKEWVERLKNGMYLSEDELKKLHVDFGMLLGDLVNKFSVEEKISHVDFIASHGHTIFHEPAKGITLQVGDGQCIANKTRYKVICDFRSQDVQLGGQGAPLVPIGDDQLFSQYEACLNLGGFANISFTQKKSRIAFDVCPVNIVLNHYAKKLGYLYDAEGAIASSGTIQADLLDELNSLSFYQQAPPKSLGFEWVLTSIFPIIGKYDIATKDILRTFVEHVAIQMERILKNRSTILITGGGAFNLFLIERMQYYVDSKLIIPSGEIVNYKEALIFSFLGLLKIEDKINCLSSVTGAKKNHSSGVIFHPNNS